MKDYWNRMTVYCSLSIFIFSKGCPNICNQTKLLKNKKIQQQQKSKVFLMKDCYF